MKSTGKIWIFFEVVSKKQTKPMTTVQAQVFLLNLKVKDPRRYFLWTPGWTEWVPLARFLESDQTFFVVAPAPTPEASPAKRVDDDKTMKIEAQIEETITKVLHPDFNLDDEDSYTQIEISDRPPKKVDYGYYYEDFSADKIDPESLHRLHVKLPQKQKNQSQQKKSEERQHERLSFRIEVILINQNGRAFRTRSMNISLGGTLLEDEIPKEFINTKFDLILVNKFEKDSVKGRLHFQGRVVGDYSDPRRLMFIGSDEHTVRRLEQMLKSYVEHQKTMRSKKKKSAG